MSRHYFKAVRPGGTDFRTGTVQWAPPVGHEGEWIVRHPTHRLSTANLPDAGTYLSVATTPTDCTGMRWPCRLLVVEPVSTVRIPCDDLPSKRAGWAFRVVEEVDPCLSLGPQGREVAALIDRASRLTAEEPRRMSVAWTGTRRGAWDAAWDAARGAARDAAWATVIRDLITPEQYDALMAPWWAGVGRDWQEAA